MKKKIFQTTLALVVLLSSSLLTGNVSKVNASETVVERAWVWGLCSTPGSSCQKTKGDGFILKFHIE
jgi:hypothetical protein